MRTLGLLVVLISGLAQAQVGQPKCKPAEYWGVKGCQPTGKGLCPRGYQGQHVCPPNPMMKAPCELLCVLDSKKNGENGPSQTRKQALASISTCEYKYSANSNFGVITADAIIALPTQL